MSQDKARVLTHRIAWLLGHRASPPRRDPRHHLYEPGGGGDAHGEARVSARATLRPVLNGVGPACDRHIGGCVAQGSTVTLTASS
jgi:hypothetical protein